VRKVATADLGFRISETSGKAGKLGRERIVNCQLSIVNWARFAGEPLTPKDLRIPGRLGNVPIRSKTFRNFPFRSVSFRFFPSRCIGIPSGSGSFRTDFLLPGACSAGGVGGRKGFSYEQSQFGGREIGGKQCGRHDLVAGGRATAPENKPIWRSPKQRVRSAECGVRLGTRNSEPGTREKQTQARG